MNTLKTQNLWQSIPWWLGMILGAVQVALTSCIDQGIGEVSTLTVCINVITFVLMFCNCNNPGLSNSFTPAAGETLTPESEWAEWQKIEK